MKIKSKEQLFLEEAYKQVRENKIDWKEWGKNNPNWDPEKPFTTGQAFKPLPSSSIYPKQKSDSPPKTLTSSPKTPTGSPKKKKQRVSDLNPDVENQTAPSVAHSVPTSTSEDFNERILDVSAENMERIYRKDPNLFERLFNAAQHVVEHEDKSLSFLYISRKMAEDIKNLIIQTLS